MARNRHDPPLFPHRPSIAADYLALLSMLSAAVLVISNILGAKIWVFGPFRLDGGILIFPIAYVTEDILVEVYGKRTANAVANRCCIINILACACFWAVDLLPDAPGVANIALSGALGLSVRIMVASTVAYWVSQHVNNFVFEDMRPEREADDSSVLLGRRAAFSSLCARFLDTGIFTIIAFWGRESGWELFQQALTSLLAGMIVEGVLIVLVTVRLARAIKADLRHAIRP